jgi:hypothetical protein
MINIFPNAKKCTVAALLAVWISPGRASRTEIESEWANQCVQFPHWHASAIPFLCSTARMCPSPSYAPPASAAAPLTFLPLRRRALPRLSPSSCLTTRAARHSTFLLDPRDLTDTHCPFLRRMSLDSPAGHVPSKLMPQIWSRKFQLHRFPLPCLASFPAPPLAFPTSWAHWLLPIRVPIEARRGRMWWVMLGRKQFLQSVLPAMRLLHCCHRASPSPSLIRLPALPVPIKGRTV